MDARHDLPDPLTAGPLSLPVARTPAGLMVSAADRAAEPLAYVVNAAFGGVLDGLEAELAAGRSVSRGGLYALNPGDVDGEPEGADAWRALTGEEPGEDALVVGTDFFPSVLVPRRVMLELLRGLRERREAEPPAPG